MLFAFVSLLAAAEPTAASPTAPTKKVLVLELEAVSVDKSVARSIDPIVLNAAGEAGVDVVAQTEMKALAKMEAEKAELGCDASSCLAELAGAMGAQYVLFGSVSKLGAVTTVALSLYDNASGAIVRDSLGVADLGALPHSLPPHVRALVATVKNLAPPSTTTSTSTTGSTTSHKPPPQQDDADAGGPMTYLGMGGVILGGAALVGGAVLATLNELAIQDPHALADTKRSAQETGGVGLIVGGVGAVVAGAGAVVLVLE